MKIPILLIVNGNEELLCLMAKILSNYYFIVTAKNGKERIDIIKENKIDVVISDEILPDINGLDFCRILKHNEKTKNVFIIVLMFNYSACERVNYYNAGVNSCVSKPFELVVLRSIIDDLAIEKL